MKFRVAITRREGLRDPEGVATQKALQELGYGGVDEVHFGRTITLVIDGDDEASARAEVIDMCERLLANPVIEDYVVEAVE